MTVATCHDLLPKRERGRCDDCEHRESRLGGRPSICKRHGHDVLGTYRACESYEVAQRLRDYARLYRAEVKSGKRGEGTHRGYTHRVTRPNAPLPATARPRPVTVPVAVTVCPHCGGRWLERDRMYGEMTCVNCGWCG